MKHFSKEIRLPVADCWKNNLWTWRCISYEEFRPWSFTYVSGRWKIYKNFLLYFNIEIYWRQTLFLIMVIMFSPITSKPWAAFQKSYKQLKRTLLTPSLCPTLHFFFFLTISLNLPILDTAKNREVWRHLTCHLAF